MKAIYKNPFNDTIYQIVEVVSEKDDNTTIIITTNGMVSVKSKRLITIPEVIAILEKEINNEMVNNET